MQPLLFEESLSGKTTPLSGLIAQLALNKKPEQTLVTKPSSEHRKVRQKEVLAWHEGGLGGAGACSPPGEHRKARLRGNKSQEPRMTPREAVPTGTWWLLFPPPPPPAHMVLGDAGCASYSCFPTGKVLQFGFTRVSGQRPDWGFSCAPDCRL